MCYGSFDISYFQTKAAEMERRPAPVPVATTPHVLGAPATARAVIIDSPMGRLTFYVRERTPAQRLRGVIADLAVRRWQTVPQFLESLAA